MMGPMDRLRSLRCGAAAATLALVAVACGGADDGISSDTTAGLGDPGDCTVVDMSVSSEKIELLTELAREFNESSATTDSGSCIFVRPQSKSSGGAATLLATSWDEGGEGPRPVIWSPAASSWGAVLNQRLADAGRPAMAPTDATPFMLTPLVVAMPKPMADALGYPEQPIGWKRIAQLATDPSGWASVGHPEWGPFRLGKTNPNFSTSGLSALIAQTYAATGKTRDLGSEDLANPTVQQFSKDIESAVVHYGDITMTFLNNWFRADRRGTALTYASAVAVEEKSVIDYNLGNPDGVLDPGEEPRKPKIPLVAIYPEEGTLYSDNPFFVLDAEWVSDDERDAAAKFQAFVQRPENQRKVLEFGFRPGNPEVAVGAPVTADNGVDPDQPATLLSVPRPEVMVSLLDQWAANRKTARVLMVLDVSGSMGDEGGDGETKLELAKQAAIDALDEFNPSDEVGLRVFSTNLGAGQDQDFLDLQPIGPIGANKERLAQSIRGLTPQNGTPLFTVADASFRTIFESYDPTRINAVILLTDGVNDDGEQSDDQRQRDELIAALRTATSGENAKPVRMFTVAYGTDADTSALKAIAEASTAAAYTATDAATIAKVFTQVVSNF